MMSVTALQRLCACVMAICMVHFLPAAGVAAAAPSEESVHARAAALLAQMTPEEKAGQMSEYFYFSQSPQMARMMQEKLKHGEIGALLFVTDPAVINQLQRIATTKTRLKIPLLFGYDVIHGFRTVFPVPIALAASWDPGMVETAQTVAAEEARAVGIHWTFAPNHATTI